MGVLAVDATLAGEVHINGTSLRKKTPLVDHRLAVGTHNIQVRWDDGTLSEPKALDIRANIVQRVAFAQKTKGSTDKPHIIPNNPPSPIVKLTTTPKDATVLRDGKTLGKGAVKLTFQSADDKPIKLRVQRPGYLAKTLQIHPKDGELRHVALARAGRAKPPVKETKPNPKQASPQPTKTPRDAKKLDTLLID